MLALLGFSASLWLEVSQFKHEGEEDDIASIRLEGMTGVFASLQISNRIAVIFDAPEQRLRMNLELSAEGAVLARRAVDTDERPFCGCPAPTARSRSPPRWAAVISPGAELQLLAPSAGEQALLTVKFDAPYPA